MVNSVNNCQQSKAYNTEYRHNKASFRASRQNRPDTFEKQDSKKSNKMKWGIGLGLAAVGTVLILALSRGKSVSSNNIKQLAEHIEFKEAKTMEEAQKYAMDNFGMKLELGDNLFTANLINDMCTNVSNKLKGKVAFPKKCFFDSKIKRNMLAYYRPYNNTMGINAQGITRHIAPNGKDINWLDIFAQKKYSDIIAKSEKDTNSVSYKIIKNIKHNIYHELGHCNHMASINESSKLKFSWFKNRMNFKSDIKDNKFNKICEEFFEDSTNYWKTNMEEFVAETFAWKMMGKDVPKEIEELYIKYGGLSF